MVELFEIRQDSLTALADGNALPASMLRMGLLSLGNKWDLLALQGRMFTIFQGTIGTVTLGSAADNAGIVTTAPATRLTVPTGYTFFPHRLQYSLTMANTAVDVEIAMLYSQTDSFTSSTGTTLVPKNLRPDNPRTSVATSVRTAGGGANLEAALTNVRIMYQRCLPLGFKFGTSYNSEIAEEYIWDDLIPIVGPASILLFFSAKTSAVSPYHSFTWAEVETQQAVKAV